MHTCPAPMCWLALQLGVLTKRQRLLKKSSWKKNPQNRQSQAVKMMLSVEYTWVIFSLLFFFFFFGCTCGTWKFPEPGSNPSSSCDLHHTENWESLTHYTTGGTPGLHICMLPWKSLKFEFSVPPGRTRYRDQLLGLF